MARNIKMGSKTILKKAFFLYLGGTDVSSIRACSWTTNKYSKENESKVFTDFADPLGKSSRPGCMTTFKIFDDIFA